MQAPPVLHLALSQTELSRLRRRQVEKQVYFILSENCLNKLNVRTKTTKSKEKKGSEILKLSPILEVVNSLEAPYFSPGVHALHNTPEG